MKRVAIIILSLAVLISMLSGCSGNNTAAQNSGNSPAATEGKDAPQEIEKIKIYVPTTANVTDIDTVMEKVNEITRVKIGVEVEFKVYQFGQWFQQYSLFLSGTEDVDILANYGGFLNAVSQGAAYDMTELLAQYGQDIIALEGDFLKSGMIDGRQYAIPLYAAYAWNMGILYRKDVVEELGLAEQVAAVKTLEDWESILAVVKEQRPDLTPFVSNGGNSVNMLQFGTWDALGNVYGVLMDGGKTSQVENLFATEEYAHLCSIMHDWYEKGYSSKDILTQTDNFTTLVQNDAAFSTLGQSDFNTEFYQTTTIGKPIGTVSLADPVARTYTNSSYTIMSNTKHPEACMKFLNLWFSDMEVGNLIKYGIEGVHYRVDENGMATYLDGQDLSSCTYHLGSCISNINAIRWDTENPNYSQLLVEANNNAPKSLALGFTFNTENVANEITQLDNVCAKYRAGLETGALDPATELPAFLEALKNAGIDTVIAEKQAQLDAFLGK